MTEPDPRLPTTPRRAMRRCPVNSADLAFENHGTVILVHSRTDRGASWLALTAPPEAAFLGSGMAVELHYAPGVALAALNDGLGVALTRSPTKIAPDGPRMRCFNTPSPKRARADSTTIPRPF